MPPNSMRRALSICPAYACSHLPADTLLRCLQIVLGRYRVSQNIARMVGPFVG